jgi:TrmH family RNA methyltransferase
VSYDITSPGNERIKSLVRLRDRSEREQTGLFTVEGDRLYSRAVQSGLTPITTFVSEDAFETVGEVIRVEPSVLDKASYRKRSQGIIGVFRQFETGLGHIELSANPLLLVVEGIAKPGNLGAMMRTAAAAGADAVVTVDGTVDPFNPNVVRSSTGALFTLPLAVSSWDETGLWLEDHGIGLVGASPDGEVSLWDADLTGPVAILVGAEDAGLSEQAAAIARELVVVPQTDRGVDSLNASVAAAVVLFEVVRQRRG